MDNIEKIFHRKDGIRISSEFGWRTSPITGKSEFHRGVDFATNGRTLPQYALDDGYVARCGIDNTNAIFAEVAFTKLGIVGQYYHLSKLNVKLGQKVNENTIIGNTGTTGNSTGIHLHFGMYPIDDLKVSYYSRRWRNFMAFEFTDKGVEIVTVDPSISLYILKNTSSSGYPVRNNPNGAIEGYTKKGEWLTVHKITKDFIKGYKWCLVDTYTLKNVWIQVDLDYMRFEI
ncbi:MAG: M23 family metallopeptidase [Tissierellia bacterium]|nr:M23 family metallopeptidase [Tissierellia bacterium]